MSAVTQFRASLIELYQRYIPLNKENSKEVYWNGSNNLYPNEIERVIQNSPTASRSAAICAKYIAGEGVYKQDENGEFTTELADYEELPVLNTKHGYKITDLLSHAADCQAKQSGIFVHIGYAINTDDGSFIPSEPLVLDYTRCRKAKDDDEKNPGKIYFKDYEKKERIGKKKEPVWYYPYNPNPDVIRAQIKADAGKKEYDPDDIVHYRGQVYYLNLTPQYQYALSRFDPVYNDMDTEYRMGLYTNTSTREGFMGKTSVITQGLSKEQSEQIEKDIAEWLGSEGSSNVYHLNVAHAEDLSKVMYIHQVKSQFDDKLFDSTEKRCRRNILGAANNLPEPLVYAGEGSLFGTSADTYTEMKRFYSEQTQADRQRLQEMFTKLGFPCRIKPIVEPQSIQNVPE